MSITTRSAFRTPEKIPSYPPVTIFNPGTRYEVSLSLTHEINSSNLDQIYYLALGLAQKNVSLYKGEVFFSGGIPSEDYSVEHLKYGHRLLEGLVKINNYLHAKPWYDYINKPLKINLENIKKEIIGQITITDKIQKQMVQVAYHQSYVQLQKTPSKKSITMCNIAVKRLQKLYIEQLEIEKAKTEERNSLLSEAKIIIDGSAKYGSAWGAEARVKCPIIYKFFRSPLPIAAENPTSVARLESKSPS